MAAEGKDPCERTLIRPVRILWVSENTEKSSVLDPEILLKDRYGQVPEGTSRDGSGCRLENGGSPASILLDFGRELHGGLLMASGALSNRSGAIQVRIRFGESVSEAMAELGDRRAGNDHAIRDSVIDLPWFGTREIGNTGFRFVRIDFVSKGVLSLESVRAVSRMRAMPRSGSFACSDERLTRIWDTAAYTLHLCCQEYIWDGIKRDRLVWMGDMHPEILAMMAVFGPQDVVKLSLSYMKETTPSDQWMNTLPSYTLWWVYCLKDWYRYTGDIKYLKEQQDYLRAVLTNVEKYVGSNQNVAFPKGFIDWPTQHNPKAVESGMHALSVMAFESGAELAAALQDDDLEKQCRSAAGRLRTFLPGPENSKPVASLLVLSGLADAGEMHRKVLSKGGSRDFSTFYGCYMLEAMSIAGDIQCAVNIVRDYWGGMLDIGATSFWEHFDLAWTENAFRIDELPVDGKRDIHGDCGEFCYTGFRHSLCHGWASGVAAWMSRHILGIKPEAPGCRTVRITPFLGDLNWAEGTFPTPLGIIHVRHEKQADGTIKSQVHVPEGITVLQ